MGERFLVVEDDDLLRKRLTGALERRGFEASGAATLDEARAACGLDRFDRMVLDLRVGSDSGLDLLRELDSAGILPRTVLLSGYGTITTAVDAVKLGAVNFLTKPAGVDAILRAFEEAPGPVGTPDAPTLRQVEWEYTQRVLKECDGNITHAARVLGLPRRSLQRKLAKDPGRLR